jgi:hypothetical protein
MDWRDIAPVFAGIVIVLVLAIVARPAGLSFLASPRPSTTESIHPTGAPNETQGKIPVDIILTPTQALVITSIPQEVEPNETQEKIPVKIVWIPSPTPVPTPTLPSVELYRIVYTDNPLSHPRFRLPDNIGPYGGSGIPHQYTKNVVFAYLDESRGGITQNFTVPYPVWVINATVIADRQPEYAHFRMVLCDAKTGEIYRGGEVTFPGSIYKQIQVSGKSMYLIISTEYVDRIRINFETSVENIIAFQT